MANKPSKLGSPFLDCPSDIRHIILKLCLSREQWYPAGFYLSKYEGNDVQIQFTNPRSRKTSDRSATSKTLQTYFRPTPEPDTKKSAVACPTILRVCRQLHDEGVEVLYGENHLVTYQPRRFSYLFAHQIGFRNLNRIKHLTMGLPVELKVTSIHLATYLEFFCERLISLRCLSLTTEVAFLANPYPGTEKDGVDREAQDEQGLFHTAAWIVLRHPILERAVYKGNKEMFERTDDEDAPYIAEIKMVAKDHKVIMWEGFTPEEKQELLKEGCSEYGQKV